MWMLSSDENTLHPWISSLCLLLHFLALEALSLLVFSSLDTSIIFSLAQAEMRPVLLFSFLRLHHFCFHVCKDLLSAARLRTRRDFSY